MHSSAALADTAAVAPGNSPASMIDGLTGVRFWAALWVVSFHLAGPGVATHFYLINPIAARGSMGVDLFYVLSGYIIHHVYSRTFARAFSRRAYYKFITFRIARMYPVHIFTMALMFILYFAAVTLFKKLPPDNASYQLPAVIANLLMVHAWFDIGSPNIPAWSISAEWFMYLLYPLLAMALFRMKPAFEWLLLPVCLIAAHFLIELHPLTHILPEFIFGATLYQLNAANNFTKKTGEYAGIFILAIIVAFLCFKLDSNVVYMALFGLLIVALTSARDRLSKMLSHPYCIYLGEISYSLYMVHSFVWSVMKTGLRIIAPSLDFLSVPVVFLGVLLSIFAAAVTYHLIEVPGRRIIRRWIDAKDKMIVA